MLPQRYQIVLLSNKKMFSFENVSSIETIFLFLLLCFVCFFLFACLFDYLPLRYCVCAMQQQSSQKFALRDSDYS